MSAANRADGLGESSDEEEDFEYSQQPPQDVYHRYWGRTPPIFIFFSVVPLHVYIYIHKITRASLTGKCADVCECARVDPADSRDLWPRRMINHPEPPPPRVLYARTHARTHTHFRRYRFGTGCSSV
jgi:hypothetical protein